MVHPSRAGRKRCETGGDVEPRGVDVVGAAGSVAEAIAPDGEPDVAVVDLHRPVGDGISLGSMLKARWPQQRALILTMNADSNSVVRSLGAGLDGYVLKDAHPEELLSAIHSAATGFLVLGRGASEAVVRATASAPRTDVLGVLDAREMEILNRVSDIVRRLGAATKDRAWVQAWSLEQIANRIQLDFPDEESMRISHEAIYLGISMLLSSCLSECRWCFSQVGWVVGQFDVRSCR